MDEKKEPSGTGGKRTIRFIFLYSVIGIIIAAYSATIYYYVSMQINDNTRINAAGRMRMLTQKMTKEILLYEDRKIPRGSIENSTMVFNITVYGITRGGAVPLDMKMTMSSKLPPMDGTRSRSELESVIFEWIPFRDHLQRYLDTRNPASLQYILGNNEHLVDTIDRTVMAVQRHANRDLRNMWLIISSAIILVIAGVFSTLIRQVRRSRTAETRLAEIEQLLPICSSCKKIRTDNDNPANPKSWTSIDEYLREKKDMIFTHSICPDCMMKLYPGMIKDESKKD